MRRLRFICLMVTLISMHSFADSLAPTDQFIATVSSLLEQGSVGDDELLALVDGADAGRVENPISEQNSRKSVDAYLSHLALEQVLAREIDPKIVATWAIERVADRARADKRRQKHQEETVWAWKNAFQRFSSFGDRACGIKTGNTLVCFGRNPEGKGLLIPEDLGPVVSVAVGALHICVVRADLKVQCFFDRCVHEKCEVPRELGQVRALVTSHYSLCAVELDGTFVCFPETRTPVRNLDPFKFLAIWEPIQGGPEQCIVRQEDSALVCFGSFVTKEYADWLLALGPIESVAFESGQRVCAIAADKMAYCWNRDRYWPAHFWNWDNTVGQVEAIQEVGYKTCVITADQFLVCDNYGNLQRPLGDQRVIALSAGYWVLGADGRPKCIAESCQNIFVPEDLIVSLEQP